MEPQHSIFLYSKYSENCKRFVGLVQSSGVDLGLQMLCVDNEKVRQRIQKSQNMDINQVPCILLIYPNGGVEKYEGSHAFRWVETILSRLMPPRRQPSPPQPPPEQEIPQQQSQPQPPSQPQRQPPQQRQSPPQKQRPKMRPINEVPNGVPNGRKEQPTTTSIDDIPTDEENEELGDRHKNMPVVPRIRKDRGNYEESDEYFEAPQPEIPRENVKAVRKIQTTTANDPSSLMAKADAMRKSRSQIEQQKPNGEQLQNRP